MALEKLQKVFLFMEFRGGEGRCLALATQGPLPGLELVTEFHQTREGFLEAVMLSADLHEGQTQREKIKDYKEG